VGFKCPLSYTSSFYFIARKNGVERKYMMYEGEESNMINLLYEQPTKESNGVKVIVPVKHNDKWEFIKKINEQLAYFENVYFDVDGIDNNFSIHRGEHFQYSELSKDESLHICLDNVYYPIDFQKLGIDRIGLPFALKFSLSDGIFPTPNREMIRYTQEAKTNILAKIKKLADYFVDKYNDSSLDSVNIKTIFNYYESRARWIELEGRNYNIVTIISFASKSITIPKLKGVDLLNLKHIANNKQYLLGEYENFYMYRNGNIVELKNRSNFISLSEVKDTNCYILTGRLFGKKREFLKSELKGGQNYQFIKKTKTYSLKGPKWGYSRNYTNYVEMLELDNYSKENWRQIIKEFQYVQSLYTNKFIDYDKIEITQAWEDSRKKVRVGVDSSSNRRLKLKGEITGKMATNLKRTVSGKNCKFVPDVFKLEKLCQNKYLTVYIGHDHSSKLDRLYNIFSKQKVKFITFSDREIKILEQVEIHNVMSYSKFMEGKTKPFKRIITSYLIEKLINKHKYVFEKRSCIKPISTSLYDKLELLRKYKDEHFKWTDESFYKEMLVIAEEFKLFDMEVYHIYKEIDTLLDRLPFINTLLKTIPSSNYYGTGSSIKESEIIPILSDMFKYYRFRINYTQYNLEFNKTVLTEEIINETTI
jgi:hypothetical protein